MATAATAAAADGGLADQWLTDRELGLLRGGTATGQRQGQHRDSTTMSQLISVGGSQRAPQGQRRGAASAGGGRI